MKNSFAFLILGTFALASFSFAETTHEEDLVRAGDIINGSFGQNFVKETGRTWDLAISGNGFFPLQDSKTGENLYTRLGRFELGRDGYVTLEGHPNLKLIVLIGEGPKTGPLNVLKWIRLGRADVAGLTFFEEDSSVSVIAPIYTNGETKTIGKFRLAQFFNNGKLREAVPHVFKADAAALPVLLGAPMERGLGRINAGMLEQL